MAKCSIAIILYILLLLEMVFDKIEGRHEFMMPLS